MKTYLLAAAGVIFLSVIVSLLIPEGKLNKTITFVMRMACILVLIQPVTGLFGIDASTTAYKIAYDYQSICTIYSNNQSSQLNKLLMSKFEIECESTVIVEYSDNEFAVTGVEVAINNENVEIIDEILEYLQSLGYINITVYAKSN